MSEVTSNISGALREHLAVCNELLTLTQRESEALKDSTPFPMGEIRAERKNLLLRLEDSMRSLTERRLQTQVPRPAGSPDQEYADLLQTTLDTIMRILVLSRENEEHLLRRGLLPASSLPPAEQSQPNYVAQLYRHHARS